MKFTDRQILNLKPRAQRYEVFEDRGFGIRIAPSGRKTFIYFYRMPGESKKRRLTIGSYPAMSLAEAHRRYAEAREMVTRGIDPGAKAVVERSEDRKAPKLATLANEYLEKWAKPRKRSWREDKRILEKDVLPIWGQRKAKDITRRDVIRLLDDIVDRGAPIMANRTLAVIRRMFNFAISRDIVLVSPCLAVRAPAPEKSRDRVLTMDEIRALWHGLEGEAMSGVSEGIKVALKLELVTGQRKSEVVSAAWEEVDIENRWWTIPAEKTMLRLTHNVENGLAKNKLAHRVPLSLIAVELLQRIKAVSGDSPWLFPSPRGNKPITPEAVNHALRLRQESLGIAFVPHDLRRTAATNMASMGISSSIIGKILNHKDRTVLAIHYNHYDYDREKRQAMETWGRKLKGIVEGTETNVIPLVRGG